MNLTVTKRRDRPTGWLVMNAHTTVTVPTFAAVQRLLRDLDRARRHAMHDTVTITCRRDQIERVLTLADERVHHSPDLEMALADIDAIATIRDEQQAAALAL